MTDKQGAVSEKKAESRKLLDVSEATLREYKENFKFRSVAPGKTHDPPITGAASRWNKQEGDEIIYDPVYRTAGTEEQIRMALSQAGVSQAAIDSALPKAYTPASVSNEGEIQDQYFVELDGAKHAVYRSHNHGIGWEDIGPFLQAKKSDISCKGKPGKKGRSEPRVVKPKTAAEIQKGLVEKKSDFVLVFGPKGYNRMKETSIGTAYYFSKEYRVAFQTPEELAAAKAALDFGDFDIEGDFDAWYQAREVKPAATAVAAPAKGSQSPVRGKPAAKAQPSKPAEAKAAPAKAAPAKAAPAKAAPAKAAPAKAAPAKAEPAPTKAEEPPAKETVPVSRRRTVRS